jgi:hypothetical protein
MAKALPFRQVHLDFHTSPDIPEVGAGFDAAAYVATLTTAHVESVNTFAKCHHGFSYYETRVGRKHPNLRRDLLGEQFRACKAAGLGVVIYVSVGWDERAAFDHADWRQVQPDGTFFCALGRNLEAAWSYLCLGSAYLDELEAQVAELAALFPSADGFWLDIVRQTECCCSWCRRGMRAAGLDWLEASQRRDYQQGVLATYFERIGRAARSVRPDMPVFHNQGHIGRGDRRKLAHDSHLEIESLPTGGWGYDHFPVSARYADTLGKPFLGMTGKFHTVWGEFGGYKHPNALRYECAVMLAHGARCSVGDQLDPVGRLDDSTYRLIGTAFAEVAAREPWCVDASPCADVAVLSSQAVNHPGETRTEFRNCPEDDGAARMLLETHRQFAVIDTHARFEDYALLVLPDRVRLTPELAARLGAYVSGGGRLLLSAASGLSIDRPEFAIDLGVSYMGPSPFKPDFVLPDPGLRPPFCDSPFVLRGGSQRVQPTTGRVLAQVFDPYFNRTPDHFNGHQHTAARHEPSGFAAAVAGAGTVYVAHPVFSEYRELGQVYLREYVNRLIGLLLGERDSVRTNLPSTARVTLRHQPARRRYVLHLLHATPVLRGQTILGPLEVIEDLPPLVDVSVSLKLPHQVTAVSLVPQQLSLPFRIEDGRVVFGVDRFSCHQMVELAY